MPVKLNSLSKQGLLELADDLGLPREGNRASLLERLSAHATAHAWDPDDIASATSRDRLRSASPAQNVSSTSTSFSQSPVYALPGITQPDPFGVSEDRRGAGGRIGLMV